MKYQTRLLPLIALLVLPFGLMADNHMKKVHKIVIDSDGAASEADIGDIEEIIERIDAEGDTQTRIVIARDHDGDVEVEKFVEKLGHGGHHAVMKRHHPGMGKMGKMSEDAAECVLKNIRNAQSDTAARAVVRACRTLNPGSEGK
jgi:hypothetical protein